MRPKAAAGVVAIAGSLFLSSALLADEPKEPKDSKATAPAAESAGKTPPRMIVVKDADTGQLRAPTAKEIETLGATGAGIKPAFAAAGPPTTVETLSSGRVRAQLGPEYFRYSVARKNPDGSLSEVCVTASKADAAVNASVTARATKPAPAAKPVAEEK